MLAIGSLLIIGAIGLGIWYAVQHENELANLILAQIAARTGFEVQTSGVRLGLGTRLVVVLETTRLAVHGQEAARIRVLRAVFSYWNLLQRRGLPLYALVFDGGTINLNLAPFGRASPESPIAQLQTLSRYLNALTDFSRSFALINITLLGPHNQPLADHVTAEAYRQHYRHGSWPWVVGLNARLRPFSVSGTRLSARVEIGHLDNPTLLAQGQVRFWQLPLAQLGLAYVNASAHLTGEVTLALSVDAELRGRFTIATQDLILQWPSVGRFAGPDDLWSRGAYFLSQSRAELSSVELYRGNSPLLEGRSAIFDPFGSTPAISFSASGINVRLADANGWLRRLPKFPARLLQMTEGIRSGTFAVNEIALKEPQPLEGLRLDKLWTKLQAAASVNGLAYVPAPETHLPTLYRFDARINYSNGVARISQASGQAGATSISDIVAAVDLSRAPAKIGYRIDLRSWLDVGEAYEAAVPLVRKSHPELSNHVLWLQGHSWIRLRASGTVEQLNLQIPRDYLVTADLGDIEFELQKLPTAIWLSSGRIEVDPARILLNRVTAMPLDQSGNLVLSGAVLWQPPRAPGTSAAQRLETRQGSLQFRDLRVELHQIAPEKWVPLFVSRDQLSVSGSLDGSLTLNSMTGRKLPIAVGRLALERGSVQPGFLRNPMIVKQSATLVLDGKGLTFDLPAALLEGEPLHFRMTIADLNHPRVRITAAVARIDFEVMRFIRLPWSPSTPPVSVPFPVSGHIEAQAGSFDKLAMTAIAADFYHDSQIWHVTNFHAIAFNGVVALTISGRARDDWVNIKGSIAHMDVGPLFLLSGSTQEPPIMGKLAAVGDLWADTNSDFFNTLAGTVSITITDGNLNRFTLMKRILSLVNLKNYLTAQFPDPRQAGLPFKTLDADFRAVHGEFYTDNLRLNGPVMDITARGNINLANNTIDMEIDLLALQTVNWLINNIPLIGKHLGDATKHLVGAYFQVRGPTDDPAIWPKPLTSVAEFVFRTLTLPINIVAPNTIE